MNSFPKSKAEEVDDLIRDISQLDASQERKDVSRTLRQILANKIPKTAEEFWQWIYAQFGIRLAYTVTSDEMSSPLEVLWAIFSDKINRVVWTGGRGIGKMLRLDTLLPTSSGWTTMGDVKIGDELFDESGIP